MKGSLPCSPIQTEMPPYLPSATMSLQASFQAGAPLRPIWVAQGGQLQKNLKIPGCLATEATVKKKINRSVTSKLQMISSKFHSMRNALNVT